MTAPGTPGAGRDDGVVERTGTVPVLRWPSLEALGVDAVVTTREGGVSEGPYATCNLGLHVGDDPARVLENRRRALKSLGADLADLVVATQVHGADLLWVGRDDRGRGATDAGALGEADALATATPGVVLATLVADCAPVLLVDPEARLMATVHAGWRGALGGVVERAVDALVERGGAPGRLEAAIGPTVAPARYEVGAEVAAAARAALGPATSTLAEAGAGRWRFDLAGAVVTLLERAGVDPGRVRRSALATGPGGPFFSARATSPCGRFALLARLRP